MKKVIRTLKYLFSLILLVTLLLVLVFESELLLPGFILVESKVDFVIKYIMELMTIMIIPLSLRLFKFKSVERKLATKKQHALLRWGGLRIIMLGIPMIINTILYYGFLAVEFGYLSIILLISMIFIYPSKDKCYYETRDLES